MLTPHCSAVSGMVSPLSIVAITRLRKSSEYGFAIPAGLLPAGSLNHIRAGMGIPDSAFSGNALVAQPALSQPTPAQAVFEMVMVPPASADVAQGLFRINVSTGQVVTAWG